MNKITTKIIISLLFLAATFGSSQTLASGAVGNCPKVVYDSREIQLCSDSIVDVSLVICEGTIGTWQLDSVVWEMESSVFVTTSSLSISHNYHVSGEYYIDAIAYFSVDTFSCSTQVVRASLPDDLCNSPLYFPGIKVTVQTIEASVYTSPANPLPYSNDDIDIILAYNAPGILSSNIYYHWFVDGQAGNTPTPSPGASPFTLETDNFPPGQHLVEVTLLNTLSKDCPWTISTVFEVLDSTSIPPCEECFTLRPVPGKRYWVSAWVKEDQPSAVKTYEEAKIQLHFNGVTVPNIVLLPKGEIIDGWQRIAGEFTVPASTVSVDIQLIAGGEDAYFDDIRIHPFNASMKSYVYDPETFWLVAELDDNNYATFYEYDKEGQLVRIKKETARGVMTISETRSSNPKN